MQLVDVEGSGTARPRTGRPSLSVVITILAIAVAGAIGIGLSFWIIENERSRELQAWQTRLSLIAEGQRRAVERWVGRQVDAVATIPESPTVAVLLNELAAADGDLDAVPDATVQREYITNYLDVTAFQAGFSGAVIGPSVPVNVPRYGLGGIALTDRNGRVIATSRSMPAIEGVILDFIRASAPGTIGMSPVFAGADGSPSFIVVAPAYPYLTDRSAETQGGWVVGVRRLDAEFFELIRPAEAISHSSETLLVTADQGAIVYLSPLADGTRPLGLQLDQATTGLASAAAVAAPGTFLEARDYAGNDVLATGRTIAGTDWVLVEKVDAEEALGDNERRLTWLLIGLLLAVGLAIASVYALWWHGASRRLAAQVDRYKTLAARFERQERLMRLIADSQPSAIFLVDNENRVQFANRAGAAVAGAPAEELAGKSLSAALGPVPARHYAQLAEDARRQAKPVANVERRRSDHASAAVVQSLIVPLSTDDVPSGTLVIEHDISDVVTARERNERVLQRTVDTLTGVVDRRDPNSADHSIHVAALARATAEEMDLDPATIEVCEMAGRLMNLGKMQVPIELLTSTKVLAPDEIERVRSAVLSSADMVRPIEFEGAVVETLEQVQERFDGAGFPHGLAGEALLISARVVAACNAFVAMTSPRAHRPRIDVDAAIELISAEAGSAFDRNVVAALINHLNNKHGRRQFENDQLAG